MNFTLKSLNQVNPILMTKYLINKSVLMGNIAIPSSKSHTLRAIIFGLLADGKSIIHHYLPSPDTQAMIDACRLLGGQVSVFPERIEIQGLCGKINCAEDVIDAGNSGIVLRFCAAIGALASHPVVITGDYSIRHYRPIKPLLEGLAQLGVSCCTMRGNDFAPIIIQGPIRCGSTVLSGEDSQPVSALLIASAFAQGPVDVHVINPGEKPWINLTLNWFDRLGIKYENNNFEHYQIKGRAHYNGFEYTIPGDLSTAAFPIAAALITHSELTLTNIDMNDCQGDKELIHVLKCMGAIIEINDFNKTLHVKKGPKLKGVEVDINNFIDALPILAVAACYAEGETLIYNAAIAKHKECNRIFCIANELRKMGAVINETEDGLHIKPSLLKGCQLHSHHDHRLALALGIAALGASGDSIISHVDCVAKTFPTFLQDFQAIGADIQELE